MTFCRFCPAACGLVVTLDGDDVVHVRGNRDHPLSHGYTCPKGRALGAWHHDPRRLDVPLVRRDGALAPSTPTACLDDLAPILREVVAASGPDAVGIFRGTGCSFDSAGLFAINRLLARIGSRSYYSTLTVDCASLPFVAELVAGSGALMPAPDADSRLVVLIGVNPMVSHGHTFFTPMPKSQLRRWAEQGELWVIDPRRTETADAATRHLAPLPGSDYALLAFLVREVLREGADADYLATWASGVDDLRRAVEPFDLERAVGCTGLAGDDVLELLASIRRARRVSIQTGTGATMAASANLTVWLTWALNIVTGSQDRPGGTWFNPGGTRRLDERTWEPGDGTPAPGPRSRPELAGRHGEYPAAALVDEIEAGNLRALIVVGGNLVTALPDADRVTAALRALDALVVLDVVETPTTALATHVLACAGQLERGDVSLLDWLLPKTALHYTPAVVRPAAQRKPVWWWAAQLGRRLEVGDVLPYGLDADGCSDEDVLEAVLAAGGAGVWTIGSDAPERSGDSPIGRLVASGHGVVVDEERAFGWVHAALPGGRWRLAPAPLVDQLAHTADPQPRGLSLIAGRQLRHLNSQFPRVAGADPRGHGAAAVVHPEDAAEAGVAEGQRVAVESAHGRVVTTVRLDARMRRGAVWLPHGYAAHNVSRLTSGAREGVDALTGMVTQTAIPVRLRPVPETAAAADGVRGSA